MTGRATPEAGTGSASEGPGAAVAVSGPDGAGPGRADDPHDRPRPSADGSREGKGSAADGPRKRGRPATIWQVAEAAGVSHQTVSRFLRADPRMRPETRARVSRAVDELGYRPNLAARSMRTQRTQRLGVIVPPTIHQGLALALGGAVDAAHDEGYSLQIFSAEGDSAARTDRAREIAKAGEVDGVLSFVPLQPRIHAETRGDARVLVESDFDEQYRAAGRLLDSSPVVEFVERLADLGHRRFLHVSGDMEYGTARERRRVFRETVDRLGFGPAQVYDGDWDARTGYRAVMEMAELGDPSRPTAVVAANDLLATGVLHAARDRGWEVPGHLSVTGWDNLSLGAQLEPTLTTVDTDHRWIGRQALQRLVAAVRGAEPAVDHTSPTTVIWRHSTGPAPE
jgi:DNA-binding LacI/PurR family transcriptional regulator